MSGQLVIIGGAEDKEGNCTILREFIRRSGGIDAKIVVMTVATELYREVGDDYTHLFEKLGVAQVQVIDTLYRKDADEERSLSAIKEATGVFFTGGDQSRITSILKGTELDKILHQQFAKELVIAGTSAGAAMMPEMMIVDGESQTNPRLETVELEPGMNFMPSVIIDQHFAQRGRLGRLISAVIQKPTSLGIGIDENTAIIVKDNEFEVVGESAVTIIDMADVTYSNLSQVLHDEDLALCDIKLHILPQRHHFNLETRKPILDNSIQLKSSIK